MGLPNQIGIGHGVAQELIQNLEDVKNNASTIQKRAPPASPEV